MRIFIIILGVFHTFHSFSQDCHQYFELDSTMVETTTLLASCFDSNSLIIAWGYSNYWANGEVLSAFEIGQNYKIKKFEIFIPDTDTDNLKIKRKRLNRKKQRVVAIAIDSLFSSNALKLNKNLLNITNQSFEENEIIIDQSIAISDGNTETFYVIRSNNCIHYHTYSPRTFIGQKYPGYMERQKFLDLIEKLDSLHF